MSQKHTSPIRSQVKLPLSVALEVVMQGIRIRIGRSIVTMMGVVLGVAFLMSVLSTNAIRKGIQEETDMRADMQRMLSFLEAETGPVNGRVISVLPVGQLSPLEQRFLRRLDAQRASEVRIYADKSSEEIPALQSGVFLHDAIALAQGSSGIIIGGDGDVPDLDWTTILSEMRQSVVATTRRSFAIPDMDKVTKVNLQRELRPEEIARMEEQKQQDRVRNIWIITIALLVTVIGITNSLLMSVTERFKEIGTMKCLGALSSFIRQIFFIESALTGLIGSFVGGIVGFLIASVIYSFTFGFGLVFLSIGYGEIFFYYFISITCGIIMSILAAIYPASFASRMVPATALRTNI